MSTLKPCLSQNKYYLQTERENRVTQTRDLKRRSVGDVILIVPDTLSRAVPDRGP
jgi:hypothetical protein